MENLWYWNKKLMTCSSESKNLMKIPTCNEKEFVINIEYIWYQCQSTFTILWIYFYCFFFLSINHQFLSHQFRILLTTVVPNVLPFTHFKLTKFQTTTSELKCMAYFDSISEKSVQVQLLSGKIKMADIKSKASKNQLELPTSHQTF